MEKHSLCILLITLLTSLFTLSQSDAKESDLAGSWYPATGPELSAELDNYFKKADMKPINGEIIGAVAPHAGLRFSGPVAAYAYKALMKKPPETVIIVGITHRKYFPGRIAVCTDAFFLTPLGKARIDETLTNEILNSDSHIQGIREAFTEENSIELQIPFVQYSMKNAKLVLIALSDQRREICDILADALYNVLKDKKGYVVIASADMCHHLPYDTANRQDADTLEKIKNFDPAEYYNKSILDQNNQRMCGFGAVYSVMKVSKELGADKAEVLKYANSGDTYGMKNSVVGYVSAVFIKNTGHEAPSAG
ncbi:MAG: AmmeMemoRadiSam system protein B, partial [Candidatus Omnitrophota bacterium]